MAERYSWERVGEHLLGIYPAALAGGSGGGEAVRR